jgi:hypothetical protein
VLLLNDDYTTMDFVVEILENGLQQGPGRGLSHHDGGPHAGPGLCGVYPFEVAETKVATVVDLGARERLSAARGSGTRVRRANGKTGKTNVFSPSLEVILTVAYREAAPGIIRT